MKFFALIWIILVVSCSTTASNTQEIQLRVNSHTIPCTGESEGECLLIQEGGAIGSNEWELFYFKDDIIGFDYEPGFIYLLTVKKSTIENPPADGSSIRYELVKVNSKEKV